MITKSSAEAGTAAGLCVLLAVTFALVTVSGCASSGAASTPMIPESVQRLTGAQEKIEFYTDPSVGAHVVSAPPASVWPVLGAVYERLAIPVATSDPRQRMLGNPGYSAGHIENEPLSRYLDCGRGMGPPYADQYSVTLLVVTRLTQAETGGTIVETTVDGSARPRDVSGSPQHCVSKGRLELRVAELVVELLEGGASVDTTSHPAA